MSFCTAEGRFWLASAPNRPIAISWPRKTAVTPIGRASARRRPAGTEPCAPGRRPPGVTRRGMAMSFTSSTNAKASPVRCRASPRAPGRGVKTWRPSPTVWISLPRRTRLSPNWRWHGKPKPGRANWAAVSAPSSNGCATTFWRWPVRTGPRGGRMGMASCGPSP
jgi:hypothetical protein